MEDKGNGCSTDNAAREKTGSRRARKFGDTPQQQEAYETIRPRGMSMIEPYEEGWREDVARDLERKTRGQLEDMIKEMMMKMRNQDGVQRQPDKDEDREGKPPRTIEGVHGVNQAEADRKRSVKT